MRVYVWDPGVLVFDNLDDLRTLGALLHPLPGDQTIFCVWQPLKCQHIRPALGSNPAAPAPASASTQFLAGARATCNYECVGQEAIEYWARGRDRRG